MRISPTEIFAIGHFDFRQIVAIGDEIAGNDVVEVENIAGQSINVIGWQRVESKDVLRRRSGRTFPSLHGGVATSFIAFLQPYRYQLI
jgi:hypothetical protein